MRLPFLKERLNELNVTDFVNELTDAAMQLGRALSKRLDVTVGQAKRYLEALEERHILSGNDRKRNRLYYFTELIDALHLY